MLCDIQDASCSNRCFPVDSRLEKGHLRLSDDERWFLFIHVESWGAEEQGAHRQAPSEIRGVWVAQNLCLQGLEMASWT